MGPARRVRAMPLLARSPLWPPRCAAPAPGGGSAGRGGREGGTGGTGAAALPRGKARPRRTEPQQDPRGRCCGRHQGGAGLESRAEG